MARGAIRVGEVTVRPGERAFGFLHIGYLAARTEVRIPFQVLHGTQLGPTLCLESTLHGWEAVGAEILRRALLRVDPARLRGTIICLPLANPFSVEFGGTVESTGLRINPADSLDLNRVWPGKREHAWLTEQMAAVLWEEVITRCDYVVDYHDGTGACDEIPVTFPRVFPTSGAVIGGDMAGGADGVGVAPVEPVGLSPQAIREMNEKIRDLAIAWGSSVIWLREEPANPAMLLGSCALHGIVPLYVEAGGGQALDPTVDQGVECTLNLLKHLGMIDGTLVLPPRQIMVRNYVVYRSRTGGYYLPEPDIVLEAQVRKGQLLGRVIDPVTSEVSEECRSPVNGVIVSRRIRLPINPGGYVAHIADTDSIIWERENRPS
ncbi:MAG: succinylglutamate desuccinylase/aspartoacylase family protein [Armatimonadota bacterium]|nr:succinylglutamate desuccinylase/aspartoacylase family protein [Armatimonadota bacterium]MDR7488510.1 succinylglutamate desuccinylase/aspartoacylase family protein [Armatimonadota bacterium]MDR7573799.1 succinylglutamate desuccinylase/aspartoacylase family protein [Armatimonadota bacterium]MDR7586737.1 succinylglutamate desuccinylase/aspartoacylase family protein [Armatimonadota bacterium]